MSFGAMAVVNSNVIIGDHFEVVIPQYKFLHDNGISNDFLLESSLQKMAEPLALESFIAFIENAVLVGHRIHFDVEMINKALEKLDCSRLKNEAIDIEVMYKKLHDINDKNFSLEELCSLFKVSKAERLSASDDSYTIALLFLKLKSRLGLK
jgi:DNA polymerase-3 subunit epsilon